MTTIRNQTAKATLAVAAAAVLAAAAVIPAPAGAQPGATLTNGTQQGLPRAWPGFLFELEFPLHSLKEVPIWFELEQLLDNPYATAACPASPRYYPNDQGYAPRCSTITRRPGFGVPLPPLLMHPLDYHPQTGEEMRLLNPNYPGGAWIVPGALVETSAGVFEWEYEPVTVSPGAARVGTEEAAIDYNSPHLPGPRAPARYATHPNTADDPACILSAEMNPPEGALVCGSDPGEPPGYSVSAVHPLLGMLRDPAGCAERNAESPLSCIPMGNQGGLILRLRRPTVRSTPISQPNYLANTDPEATQASNENDYLQGTTVAQRRTARTEAMRLGKSLFWDMQVGSDSVQSCGSCHFHAGADNRTKNQMNPNHIGGDTTFDIVQPNQELMASHFPFVGLTNPDVAGDPACTPAITASVNPGVLENNFPGGVAGLVVCDAANRTNGRPDGSPHNDVASSMGVKFGRFTDIPAPAPPTGCASPELPCGAFGPASSGVRSLMPDLRSSDPADNTDPIPGFQGDDGSGHGFRRVEPRNTPTFNMTAMNFDNFWDGRARHDFNGGSVFGPTDPQLHVFVSNTPGQPLVATRQIVRLASIASLATGPALSEFEMSRAGRNWAKLGKKLLQPGVTPLANQLVSVTDSILGVYSNQPGPGRLCAGLPAADRSPGWSAAGVPDRPGLCISYPGLIRRAFNDRLWHNAARHLDGCYTDDGDPSTPQNTPVCPAGTPHDPFDGYVLTPANLPATAALTNQFTQMEANMSLFFGLSVHFWDTILMPDDAPFDRFHDANPYAHELVGEPGEPGLVAARPLCTQNGNVQPCITEVGNFKRDVALGGTRQAGDPDPLLGMDIFSGSNVSGKNPNFRTARCAECHLGPMLTDHNIITTPAGMLGDFAPEFLTPGVEATLEPLGKPRVISGFLLESEFSENSQDGIERRIINQSIVPNPVDGLAYPDGIFTTSGPYAWTGSGSAFFDNGIYNLGVTMCQANQQEVTGRCDDVGRGDNDPFGWPMSLSAIMLKNLGGPGQQPGTPIEDFDPSFDPECAPNCHTGGLFEETAQDQQINPGFEGELDPVAMKLPLHLGPFANNVNVGEAAPEADEVAGGLNTITNIPILEGFIDTLGPFDPSGLVNEAFNMADQPLMGTCSPVANGATDDDGDGCADGIVNRVGRMGSFKAPSIRSVEHTGPYFHNGGKLTLRQVVDFYTRGGDFPITNAEHRDFNLVNMNIEVQSNLTEAEKVALVDFLLELTDDRVRFERAPFDHPEVFVPLDGTAPENTFGRSGFDTAAPVCRDPSTGLPIPGATGPCFRQVPAVGASGGAALPNFLGVTRVRNSPNCSASAGPISHYCQQVLP